MPWTPSSRSERNTTVPWPSIVGVRNRGDGGAIASEDAAHPCRLLGAKGDCPGFVDRRAERADRLLRRARALPVGTRSPPRVAGQGVASVSPILDRSHPPISATAAVIS